MKRPTQYERDCEELPYGIWICGEGTAYLFNRKYEAIWRKEPGQKAAPVDDRRQYVPFKTQFWFSADPYGITRAERELLRGILRSFVERDETAVSESTYLRVFLPALS